jgi:diadenosine tetraphosphatase ApaH/serine/threonine PP2A family protein phosphatase
LSDIHGNRDALLACIADAGARGADRIVFLGDFVGYGAEPHDVIDIIGEHCSRGAVAVRGNHDAAIEGAAGYMNEAAHLAIEYSRRVLTTTQRQFIAGLPMILRDDDTCFVHASAEAPEKWNYIDSPAAAERCAAAAERRYTFCGHVHDQRLFFCAQPNGLSRMTAFRPTPGTPVPVPAHRQWVALVGSVGQPRDRNPAAAYAMINMAKRTLTFRRVPYDHLAAAARIRAAGLPESLAYRLEHGI